jgi:hypothetical protein
MDEDGDFRQRGPRHRREIPETESTPFPIALTAENEMPRPYQIGIFPTYIVIDREGKVAAAEQGNQGFGALRKVLTKAGLEIE